MRRALMLAVLAIAAGCAGDFERYNVIQEPRVLAIRAEPPTVVIDGTTTLDALIVAPEGASVRYAWSWCPLRGGTMEAYECAVTEVELEQALADSGITVDVSYGLGAAPTAALGHPLDPAVLRALCDAPVTGELPVGVARPSCEQGYPLSVGLSVDIDGTVIHAFRDVRLALDATTPVNANPTIGEVAFGAEGTDRATATILSSVDRPLLHTSEVYALFADVAAGASEPFVSIDTGEPRDAREVLVLSWFVEAGDTRLMRTTFIDGETTLAALGENEWTLPTADELRVDGSRLFLVLRDERGGVAWTERAFAIAPR